MSVDLELDLGGKLELAIGKQTDALATKLAPCRPIINRSVAATQYPGGAEVFLDLGSPNTGRIWEVTSVTVYGIDDNTALANVKCAMYFGDTFVPSLSSLVVPNLVVPSFTGLNTETLYCEATNNVVFGIVGTGAGQVGISITYKDWPEAAIAARNGNTMP